MSDDSFECAFYGAAGFPLLCPSFQFTPPESGTYTLVLTHSVLPAVMEGPPGDCVGDTAGYVLVMDAANDLRITLAEDDVVATEIVDAQHEYRVSWEAFFGE
jgi:hypothetical protein